MTVTEKINASGLAPVTVTVPRYTPAEPTVLAKKREAARKALAKLQPPSDKKYTNWLRRDLAERFEGKAIGGIAPRLTLNGANVVGLDRATEYFQGKALPADHHYFAALSGALFKEGVAIIVPRNTKAEITADFSVESGKLNAYRTVIIVEAGARAQFFERLGGTVAKETIFASGTEVYLEEGAQLAFHSLQDLPESVTHLAAYRSHQARDSKLDWLIGSFGANFSQVHVESGLAGEGAESNIHGTYYGSGDQHFEQQLVANHLVGKTTSNTYARGIVSEQSKAVYRGMIKIQLGAHGSSADQNGHAMLLGSDAHIDAIPGLEIDADDVTAGHGATVGQIDEEQLFYLMSRGLSREQATQLIIKGFFEDLFRHIPVDTTRELFWKAVADRMSG